MPPSQRAGRSVSRQSDLERITALVTELEHDLSDDPDIDPELGALLLHHARAMAQAVRDVPVREQRGLRRPSTKLWALSACLGRISRRGRIRRGSFRVGQRPMTGHTTRL